MRQLDADEVGLTLLGPADLQGVAMLVTLYRASQRVENGTAAPTYG